MAAKLHLGYPTIRQLLSGYAMKQRTESRQFLAWFLENYYRLEEIEVEDCICDGTDDKGIDGVCVNENLQQIDVFQSRLATHRKELGDTELREFFGALNQMRTPESITLVGESTKNKELSDLIADLEISKKVAEGYKIRGVFLTNMKRNDDAIAYLKTAPELLLYDEPELQEHYVAIDKTEPIGTSISFKVATKFPYTEYPISPELKMVIAPLLASELVTMHGIASGELFAWNVRQYLGKKTKVNRDVEVSIRTPDEHKYFPAFHNGLTVLCKNVATDKKTITISGYAVVNGCQSLTGLYENRTSLTPELRILTKFIEIAPESPLARKITDHTNNQNGTSHRDLQSNSLLQTRLQTEINARYAGQFYYRIKRGEHPEWPAEQVIENELAARMLLAYDLKEPWTCHQTYKLFDELHAQIFGRQDVTGDRIIAIREIYEAAKTRLAIMDNEMFARYGLTRFLLLYLVREALQTDEVGNQLIMHPSDFLAEPNGRQRLSQAIGELSQTLVRLLDSEVTRRSNPDAFDFKRDLKSQNIVRSIRTTVIPIYQITVDSKVTPSFGMLWKQSEQPKPKRKGKKKK